MAKKKKGKKRITKAQKESRKQLFAVFLITIGIFLTILSFVKGDSGWLFMHEMMFGLLGAGAFFVGPMLIYIAVMTSFDKIVTDTKIRLVLIAVTVLVISAANQIFMDGPLSSTTLWSCIKELYTEGKMIRGGGLLGSIFALPLMMLGHPGDSIAVVLLLFMLFMIITRSTVAGVIKKARRPAEKISHTCSEISEKAKDIMMEKQQEPRRAKRPAFDVLSSGDAPGKKSANPKQEKLLDAVNAQESKLKSCNAEIEKTKEEDTSPALPEEDILDDDNKSHIEEIIKRVQQEGRNSCSAPSDAVVNEQVREQQPSEESASQDIFEESGEQSYEKPDEEAYQEDSFSLDDEQQYSGDISVDEADKMTESYEEDSAFAQEAEENAPQVLKPEEYVYDKPSVELLNPPMENTNEEDTGNELRQNAEKLVDTLQSFGVQTRIVDISRGPSVTRYELQPSAGVKISKITNLADDIALNLAAAGVRIEAPIPNKAAVGIEIPNKNVSFVSIKEVISSPVFENAKSPVTIALGKDVSGEIKIADVEKMPHLLIAGATGSGKSVCINSIIMSLIYKSDPKDVKLMLVDPKMVELGVYNGIPHLVVPVVNDPKKAAGVLGWAVSEMLKRYETFAKFGVRDIKSYNKMCFEKNNEEDFPHMAHIVIIVDELADLMMASPRDVEDHICRLAQMARAAGMHLIIATQRPSVDVITGVIKANIPSRIAFSVSSQIDSRTILDMAGAEKLIGMGDMLFFPVGSSKPTRIQGCFVSDEEIERVVDFIKRDKDKDLTYDDEIMNEIEKHVPAEKGSASASSSSDGDDGDEDIINAAISVVVESQMASTSFLQRKLKLGYARAARVIDELEARGIVGPYEGSKPRTVLMSRERYMEMKLNLKEN